MAFDASGNWYPALPDNAEPIGGEVVWRTGNGVPANSLGNNGDGWIRLDNGDLYTKNGDVYELQIGGSGGATQVVRGTADNPNSPLITPDNPSMGALYYRDSAGNAAVQFWRWSVADQNWKELITT